MEKCGRRTSGTSEAEPDYRAEGRGGCKSLPEMGAGLRKSIWIHSEAVTKSNPRAEEGSLYESVRVVGVLCRTAA